MAVPVESNEDFIRRITGEFDTPTKDNAIGTDTDNLAEPQNIEQVVAGANLSDQETKEVKGYLKMSDEEWKSFLQIDITTLKDVGAEALIMNQFIVLLVLFAIFASIKEGCTPTENVLRFLVALAIISTLGSGFLFLLSKIRRYLENKAKSEDSGDQES